MLQGRKELHEELSIAPLPKKLSYLDRLSVISVIQKPMVRYQGTPFHSYLMRTVDGASWYK